MPATASGQRAYPSRLLICHSESQSICPAVWQAHLMLPWFSTPKVKPSFGELLPYTQVADAAAVQEGCALLQGQFHERLLGQKSAK